MEEIYSQCVIQKNQRTKVSSYSYCLFDYLNCVLIGWC